MSNFIIKHLEEGEHILLFGRQHWSFTFWKNFYATLFLLGGIAALALALAKYLNDNVWSVEMLTGSIVLCVAAACIYLYAHIVRTRTEFAITETRFIQKDGIFNIVMTEIPLFKIETVNFYQTFGQRLINTGCIELVGSGGTSHKIHFIERPKLVHSTIVSAINKADEKKGGAQ